MKTLLIAIFSLFTTITFAQQAVTWIGGTPGNETSWNEAKNWSKNKVPYEFSDVIIPDVTTTTFSAPVIKRGTIELNALQIASNGKLTVESEAKLIVYGFASGILKGNVNLEGTLFVMSDFENTNLKNVVFLDKN
jgi:hypothetical protein